MFIEQNNGAGYSFWETVGNWTCPAAAFPTATAINRASPNPSTAASVSFTIVFSQTVTGVDVTDFTTVGTGGASGTITGISGSGNTYTVTVDVLGAGTLGLNLVDNDSIVNASSVALGGAGAGNGNFTGQVYTVNYTRPTVTINQAAGQADPTNAQPVNFTVVFSEAVTGFGNFCITPNLGGLTLTVTGSGTTYNVAVTGLTSNATVTLSVIAFCVADAQGQANQASTSTDNSVTYDGIAPTVTINQAAAQVDPTSASPINFTVVFSEVVTGFAGNDVTIGGTAGATTATVTGSGTTYNVAVTGMARSGTVIPTIAAGRAFDAAGNSNTASTSTDNSVTYNITISINNVTVTEPNVITTNANFTVTLSAASNQTITVNFATANGTATTADNDYVANSGTVTFAAGQTTQTITVVVNGDTRDEANETFTVNLTAPTNAIIATGTGTGTINDNDPTPTVSINNMTLTEGNTGTTSFVFTVTLSAISGQTVTVNYATANGTATTADSDYAAATGTLTFTPDQTTQTITVLVTGDTKDEPNETFTVTLNTPANATIATGTGTGTITNDDTVPTVSIDNVTVTEGNAGTTNATFTVSLSAASGVATIVNYTTNDGTATTADTDYVANSGTLTFPVGVTSQTVTVVVNGDTLFEANETFTVTLNTPVNAMIATGTGTGTITNDDTAPTLSIDNVSVTEGNAATTNATFTVTLSAVSGQATIVNYTTNDGTATTADTDYVANSGTLTFPVGVTSQTVTVVVNGDTLFEANETFTVTLNTPVNAMIATGTGTGTITNDDTAPTISIDNVTVTEGNAGTTTATFTVTLSAASGRTITVDFASADGTAVASGDYSSSTGTLTFTPGVTTQSITININGDTVYEADETYTIGLSAATNATIATATGTGTITNDDAQPTFTIADVTQAEGNTGTSSFVFTVTRSGDLSMTGTLDYTTTDGSATAVSDYVTTSGTLTFAPGVTSQTISVTVNGDISLEGDETFTVDLSNPSVPATISDAQALGTITNDDVAAGLAIADVTLVEGNAGTSIMTFTVTRNGDTTVTTTVDFATADDTATIADNDYLATTGSLTFAPGVTSQTLDVTINGDVFLEGDETFFVNLSNPSAPATISDAQALGTITNEDVPPGISVNDVTVAENAGTGQFTVTLSPIVNGTVTVDYLIVNGTALNGTHYVVVASGTLTYLTGETTQTIPFTVVDNLIVDGNHTFSVQLSNSSGPAITRAAATATILDNEVTINTLPDPPPATLCTQTNFEDPGMIRSNFTNDIDRDQLFCRLLAVDGNYMSWFGSPITSNANIGNQLLLNLGVIAAVDVYSMNGATGFVGDVNVCLKGTGHIIYLNANSAPRDPQLWSAWKTPSFPGYTCTTLYAPGTVILVQNKP